MADFIIKQARPKDGGSNPGGMSGFKSGDPFDVQPHRQYDIEEEQENYRARVPSEMAPRTDMGIGPDGGALDWADVGEYAEPSRSPNTYGQGTTFIPTYTLRHRLRHEAKDDEDLEEKKPEDKKSLSSTDEPTEWSVTVRDSEGELERLLETLKQNAGIGHSFPVVVDPDDPEYREEFFIDGDGAFQIKDIKTAKEDTVVTDSESEPMDSYEFQGFQIVVENEKGTSRHWKDRDGQEGETKMLYDYGYINGYHGVDGDEVDVYVGPDEDAEFVYVIHQMAKPDFTEHDEDKVMMGFKDEQTAKEAYLKHYDDEAFYGGMSAMRLDDFKGSLQEHAGETAPDKITAAREAMKTAADQDDGAIVDIATGEILFDPEEEERKASLPTIGDEVDRIAANLSAADPDQDNSGFVRMVEELASNPDKINDVIQQLDDVYLDEPAETSIYTPATLRGLEEASDALDRLYWDIGKGKVREAMKQANRPETDLGSGTYDLKASPETKSLAPGEELRLSPAELPEGYQGDDDPVKVAMAEAGLIDKLGIDETMRKNVMAEIADALQEGVPHAEIPPKVAAEYGVYGVSENDVRELFEQFIRRQGKTAAEVGHEEWYPKTGEKVIYEPTGRKGKVTHLQAHVATVEFDDGQNPVIRNVFIADLCAASSKEGMSFIKEMTKTALKNKVAQDLEDEFLPDDTESLDGLFGVELARLQRTADGNVTRNADDLPAQLVDEVTNEIEERAKHRELDSEEESTLRILEREEEWRDSKEANAAGTESDVHIPEFDDEEDEDLKAILTGEAFGTVGSKIAADFDREMGLAQHEYYGTPPMHIGEDKTAADELEGDIFEDVNSHDYSPGERNLSAISVQHLMEERPRLLADRSLLVNAAANAYRQVMKRLGSHYISEQVSLQQIRAHKMNDMDGTMLTGQLEFHVILASHRYRRRAGITLEMPVVAGEPVPEVTMVTAGGERLAFNRENLDRVMNIRKTESKPSRGWSHVPLSHHFEY